MKGNRENEHNAKLSYIWYFLLGIAFVIILLYWRTSVNVSLIKENILPFAPKIAMAIITLFFANFFIKATLPIIRKAFSKRVKKEEWKIIKNIYVYSLWAITIIIILTGIFGTFSSLGISLSVLGAGIAFALQQAILSFAGWILIMIRRPYKIGDRVYIKGREIRGDVDDITTLFTVIKEVDENEAPTGRSVIIPNSTIFLEPIINYSYDTPYIWLSIPVSITYESDVELAKKAILKVAKKIAGEHMKDAAKEMRRKTPESVQADLISDAPVLRMELADSSINIILRILCRPKNARKLRTDIYNNILKEISKKEYKGKVEIAYPHLQLVFDEKIRERL